MSSKAKTEVEAQKKRETGKFQTIYRNVLLIPTDPSETQNSVVDVRAKHRCDLRDFFEDWYKVEVEKRKHIDIARQLSEMLEKGLFRCSPENVFKVITTLKISFLMRDLTKEKIQEGLESGEEGEKQILKQLPSIISSLTANLINIWNSQISPQEFQYYPEALQ